MLKMYRVPNLSDYFVSETHGFLLKDPVESLPTYYQPWEDVAADLSDALTFKTLREKVDKLPLLDTCNLQGYRQYRRAHTLLSLLVNGYVWQDGDEKIAKRLPRQLAVPICALASLLSLKPVLCHPAFVLANWKLIDPQGPFIAENLTTQFHYPGGRQYEWFVVVTAEIERNAAPGLKACVDGQKAMYEDNEEDLIKALTTITDTIGNMKGSLKKMYDGLDSRVFFNVFRPFLSGWGGSESPLPEGLIYEGVSSEPKCLIGGSAAQSSILPCFDAVLGVVHEKGRQQFLDTMLDYMVEKHKDFILALRENISVNEYVKREKVGMGVVKAFNECVTKLAHFRTDHIQLVTKYIVIPASRKDRNMEYEGVANKGTGGTPLIKFLKGVRDSTTTGQV